MKKSQDYMDLIKETGFVEVERLSGGEESRIKEMIKNGEELPLGVFEDEGQLFVRQEMDLTDVEMIKYCALKMLKATNTIKNCVIFFTVLAVLSLVAALIISLT
jgi:hypothetical protein